MKWYTPVFIISIVAVIVLLIGWGFYKNAASQKPIPQVVTRPIIPTHTSSSVSTFSASPSTSAAANTIIQHGEKWETFRDEALRFQIRYPKNGWDITSKMGHTILPYTPSQEPINIYTQRAVPTQGPISAPITIAVYKKPSALLTLQRHLIALLKFAPVESRF